MGADFAVTPDEGFRPAGENPAGMNNLSRPSERAFGMANRGYVLILCKNSLRGG